MPPRDLRCDREGTHRMAESPDIRKTSKIWQSPLRNDQAAVLKQKRDIVDTTFHASCATRHNSNKQTPFPLSWKSGARDMRAERMHHCWTLDCCVLILSNGALGYSKTSRKRRASSLKFGLSMLNLSSNGATDDAKTSRKRDGITPENFKDCR